MPDELKSCALINKEVALHLGWAQVSCNTSYVPDIWYPLGYEAGRKYGKSSPPDYCGEGQHAMPLLEKLLEWHGRMEFGHEFFMVHLAKADKHEGKKLTEAITRAFHAAFVEEGA